MLLFIVVYLGVFFSNEKNNKLHLFNSIESDRIEVSHLRLLPICADVIVFVLHFFAICFYYCFHFDGAKAFYAEQKFKLL